MTTYDKKTFSNQDRVLVLAAEKNIRDVCHDVNNYITGIRGYSDILQLKNEKNNSMSELLEKANKAAEKMFMITKELSKSVREESVNSTKNSEISIKKMNTLALASANNLRATSNSLLIQEKENLDNLKNDAKALGDKYQSMFSEIFVFLKKIDILIDQLENIEKRQYE